MKMYALVALDYVPRHMNIRVDLLRDDSVLTTNSQQEQSDHRFTVYRPRRVVFIH